MCLCPLLSGGFPANFIMQRRSSKKSYIQTAPGRSFRLPPSGSCATSSEPCGRNSNFRDLPSLWLRPCVLVGPRARMSTLNHHQYPRSMKFRLRLEEALGCTLPGLVSRARSHAVETRTFATCRPFGFDRACSWSNVDFEPSPKLKMRGGTCMVCRLACRRILSRFDV